MPRKKGNGKGSVRKVSESSYEASRCMKLPNGKYRTVYGYGPTPEQALAAAAAKVELPIEYNKRATIGELGEAWYKDLARKVRVKGNEADDINSRENRTLEESTYIGYAYTLAIIKRQFEGWIAAEATTDMIEDEIMKPECAKAVKTSDGKKSVKMDRYNFGQYKKVKFMLGQIFNFGIRKKIIVSNPMNLFGDLRNPARDKKTKDALGMDEIIRIFDQENKFKGNEKNYRYYCAVIVGMAGGFRSQEVIPLLKTDIEPDGSAIEISKAVKTGKFSVPYIGHTKTEASDRLAFLPEYSWKYAKWLRDHADEKTSLVFFSDMTGTQIHPDTYRRNVKLIIGKIDGVRPLRPHELQRHTLTTIGRYKAGLDDNDLMEATGRSDTKSMRGYEHPHSEDKRAIAEKINYAVMDELTRPTIPE